MRHVITPSIRFYSAVIPGRAGGANPDPERRAEGVYTQS